MKISPWITRFFICVAFIAVSACFILIDTKLYQPLVSSPPQDPTFLEMAVLFLGKNYGYNALVELFAVVGLFIFAIGAVLSSTLGNTIKDELKTFNQATGESANKLNEDVQTYLSNINTSIDHQMQSIASTLAGRRSESIKQIVDNWILDSAEKPEVYKDWGLKALQRYYGPHCGQDNSFFSFVEKRLLERWAKQESVLVVDHVSHISVRTPARWTEKRLKEKGLLVWEETREVKYVFHKPAADIESGQEPWIDLQQFANQRVPSELLEDVLNHYQMKLTFDGNVLFSLTDILQQMPSEAKDNFIKRGQGWSNNGFTMKYDNEHLSFTVSPGRCRLTKATTSVSMTELGFIDPRIEDHYLMRMRVPSLGMKIHLNIDPGTGYVLQDYTAAVDRYHIREMSCEPKEPRGQNGPMRFETTDWVLPGLVFYFVWGPSPEQVEVAPPNC